jgi:trans-aconitate 2-methyltransferase
MSESGLQPWNPNQYNKFRDERMQPFFDLVAFIRPEPDMRVIDLGCGTGELTAMLAERLPGSSVEGIDSSPSMLDQAASHAGDRVTFRRQDIRNIDGYDAYDLVFSHAVLQWVPDNERLLRRILSSLKPGAQVAVQVPKNEGHPSHALAAELAQEPPFREWLDGFVRENEALSLEQYAGLLYEHGLREHACIEKIYGHELERSSDVIEWVKGTSLNSYLSRLDATRSAAFLDAYRERLLATIGDRSPYFYPFRRLLFWGRKAA